MLQKLDGRSNRIIQKDIPEEESTIGNGQRILKEQFQWSENIINKESEPQTIIGVEGLHDVLREVFKYNEDTFK